ncbi:hypothetical protein JCM3765_006250 [Sporobolomyces pararoseus]
MTETSSTAVPIDFSPLGTMRRVEDRKKQAAWECTAEGCLHPKQTRVGFAAIKHAYLEAGKPNSFPPEFELYWCSECEYSHHKVSVSASASRPLYLFRSAYISRPPQDCETASGVSFWTSDASNCANHGQYCAPRLKDEKKDVPSARFRTWVGGNEMYEYKCAEVLYPILIEPSLNSENEGVNKFVAAFAEAWEEASDSDHEEESHEAQDAISNRTAFGHQKEWHQENKHKRCKDCLVTWPTQFFAHQRACAKTDTNPVARAIRSWNDKTLRYDYNLPHLEQLLCAEELHPGPLASAEAEAAHARFAEQSKQIHGDLDAAEKRLRDVLKKHSNPSASLSKSCQLLPSRHRALYFPSTCRY